MGTHLQKKISVDVPADNSSLDSLSFAGLVCIQDQQTKLPNNPKHDPEFEFGPAKLDATILDQMRYSPAEILISNGRLLPHAFVFQSKQSQKAGQHYSKGTPRRTQHGINNQNQKNGSGTHDTGKANQGAKKPANKEYTSSSSWFGGKMNSFKSPCSECRAAKPMAKFKSNQGKEDRSHRASSP